MEIGGYDTRYDVDSPKDMAEKIMRFLDWKDAVTEKDEGDNFFYYKNEAAKKSWDDDVGDEDVMVYFLFDEGRLSICTDEKLTNKIRANVRPVRVD